MNINQNLVKMFFPVSVSILPQTTLSILTQRDLPEKSATLNLKMKINP